ncbi:unnamed protein product [Moneuplotes crassus]|uniref:Uncharacterized protein n=1 Tax=Euplotes crassus TaxID=5936 RepID=A0AAD1XQ31_EUPCR|nr:unnamed protein product [Moneuplotes crassus]
MKTTESGISRDTWCKTTSRGKGGSSGTLGDEGACGRPVGGVVQDGWVLSRVAHAVRHQALEDDLGGSQSEVVFSQKNVGDFSNEDSFRHLLLKSSAATSLGTNTESIFSLAKNRPSNFTEEIVLKPLENLKNLDPVTGLYIPIEKYFTCTKTKRNASRLVKEKYIYLKSNLGRLRRRRFRVFTDNDLGFDSKYLSEHHVHRIRDDDYSSDAEVLDYGKEKTQMDLESLSEFLHIYEPVLHKFVRNLRLRLKTK